MERRLKALEEREAEVGLREAALEREKRAVFALQVS